MHPQGNRVCGYITDYKNTIVKNVEEYNKLKKIICVLKTNWKSRTTILLYNLSFCVIEDIGSL